MNLIAWLKWMLRKCWIKCQPSIAVNRLKGTVYSLTKKKKKKREKKAGSEPGGCWVFVKNIFNQDCSPVSFIDNINFCITAIPNIVSYVTPVSSARQLSFAEQLVWWQKLLWSFIISSFVIVSGPKCHCCRDLGVIVPGPKCHCFGI